MRRRLGLVPDCHQSAQWRPSLFSFSPFSSRWRGSLAWFGSGAHAASAVREKMIRVGSGRFASACTRAITVAGAENCAGEGRREALRQAATGQGQGAQ